MAQEVEVKLKVGIEEADRSLSNLKSQLREAQNEVNILSEKFGATSKEAVNAAKKAAELKDRIGDAKALTDAFNPDAKFKALSGSLTGVAGGFSAVSGMMGALGSESKDVENALLKVQSAMAISSGLQTLGESVDQFKILGTVIKNTTIAQRALTIATATYIYVTEAATIGLKLLRGALISTGIGALVVAVGTLIANFDKVKATILKVIPSLSSVGDGIMNVVNKITDFIGATSESERAVDRLSAAASKSLKKNEQYLKEHGSQLDEYTKQKIAAKNEYYKLVEEDGANQKAYALELNRKLKKIDDDRLKSKKENKKKEVKTVKEINKEISAEEQKRLADEMQSATNAMAILDEIAKAKETPAQKEYREYLDKKAVLEANNLDTAELTNNFLTSQADAEYAIYEEKLAKKKEQSAKDIEIEKRTAEEKRNINSLAIQSAQGLVGILAGLGEKNKAIQKAGLIANSALSIAEIINNTNVGSSKEIATKGIFGLSTSAVLYAKMGVSIGSVIAATAKGLSALGGGSAPSTGGGGISTPQSAQPSINVVGASKTNAIAETIAQQGQTPIKAYVVANDVTTQQALTRNIVSSASIG